MIRYFSQRAALPAPVLPRVEEDPRTTTFLQSLDRNSFLVADRKDLIPIRDSFQTFYSNVTPVKFKDKVYMLKEPAVSVSSPQLLLWRRLLCSYEWRNSPNRRKNCNSSKFGVD